MKNFQEWIKALNEMPLAAYKTHFDGDYNPNTSGYMKPQDYKSKVEEYIHLNNIQVPDHITFVKNASTGEPMTPWMILHTLAHAVFDAPFNRNKRENLGQYLKNFNKNYLDSKNLANGHTPVKNFAKFLQMKSAKNLHDPDYAPRQSVKYDMTNNFKLDISNWNEVIHEMMAEYLWSGSIRYKHPSANVLLPEIKKTFSMALDACIGEIIYDTDGEGQFHPRDRLVLSHAKTVKTLENQLNKRPWDFNILMLEAIFQEI